MAAQLKGRRLEKPERHRTLRVAFTGVFAVSKYRRADAPNAPIKRLVLVANCLCMQALVTALKSHWRLQHEAFAAPHGPDWAGLSGPRHESGEVAEAAVLRGLAPVPAYNPDSARPACRFRHLACTAFATIAQAEKISGTAAGSPPSSRRRRRSAESLAWLICGKVARTPDHTRCQTLSTLRGPSRSATSSM